MSSSYCAIVEYAILSWIPGQIHQNDHLKKREAGSKAQASCKKPKKHKKII
jgi:hypothetical protein